MCRPHFGGLPKSPLARPPSRLYTPAGHNTSSCGLAAPLTSARIEKGPCPADIFLSSPFFSCLLFPTHPLAPPPLRYSSRSSLPPSLLSTQPLSFTAILTATMRFSALLLAGAFAVAHAQSSMSAPSSSEADVDTTAPSSTPAPESPGDKCLKACAPGDAMCQSHCIAVRLAVGPWSGARRTDKELFRSPPLTRTKSPAPSTASRNARRRARKARITISEIARTPASGTTTTTNSRALRSPPMPPLKAPTAAHRLAVPPALLPPMAAVLQPVALSRPTPKPRPLRMTPVPPRAPPPAVALAAARHLRVSPRLPRLLPPPFWVSLWLFSLCNMRADVCSPLRVASNQLVGR